MSKLSTKLREDVLSSLISQTVPLKCTVGCGGEQFPPGVIKLLLKVWVTFGYWNKIYHFATDEGDKKFVYKLSLRGTFASSMHGNHRLEILSLDFYFCINSNFKLLALKYII